MLKKVTLKKVSLSPVSLGKVVFLSHGTTIPATFVDGEQVFVNGVDLIIGGN